MTTITVTNCDDCPACGSFGDEFLTCNLSDGDPLDAGHLVPTWCPLRKGELTVYLDEREVAEEPRYDRSQYIEMEMLAKRNPDSGRLELTDAGRRFRELSEPPDMEPK